MLFLRISASVGDDIHHSPGVSDDVSSSSQKSKSLKEE